ncbi:hypothetical protein GCM10027059_44160 [Myceligenerans halotolerans]
MAEPWTSRTEITRVDDVGAALALCAAAGLRPVVDLDATLVPTGAVVGEHTPTPLVLRIALLVDAVIVTNRREAPATLWGIPVVARAGKPWTPASRLSGSPRPTAVIGDQLLTDGLLARRLGARFIRVVPLEASARPWRTRLADRLLAPFFRTAATDG